MTADFLTDNGVALATGGVSGLFALAFMARGVLRRWGRDVTEMTKDRVEGDLYTQLAEQVREYRKVAEENQLRREALYDRVVQLEKQVAKYEDQDALIDRLKKLLDTREAELRQMMDQWRSERLAMLEMLSKKDVLLQDRDTRINELEQKVNHLERG